MSLAIDEAVSATTRRLPDLGFKGFSSADVDQYRARTAASMSGAVVGFGSKDAFCANIELVQAQFSVAALRDYVVAINTSGADLISVDSCRQR